MIRRRRNLIAYVRISNIVSKQAPPALVRSTLDLVSDFCCALPSLYTLEMQRGFTWSTMWEDCELEKQVERMGSAVEQRWGKTCAGVQTFAGWSANICIPANVCTPLRLLQ